MSFLLTHGGSLGNHFPPLVVLPGGDEVTTNPSFPLFHLDSQGRTCFTEDEAKAASDHLADMGFLPHQLARIATTPFLIP